MRQGRVKCKVYFEFTKKKGGEEEISSCCLLRGKFILLVKVSSWIKRYLLCTLRQNKVKENWWYLRSLFHFAHWSALQVA